MDSKGPKNPDEKSGEMPQPSTVTAAERKSFDEEITVRDVTEIVENLSRSCATAAVIRLEGSHIGSTETDQLVEREAKRVTFECSEELNATPSHTSQTVENVKEYVRQINTLNDIDNLVCTAGKAVKQHQEETAADDSAASSGFIGLANRVTAEKRQQNQMNDLEAVDIEKELTKRMRGEDTSDDDYIVIIEKRNSEEDAMAKVHEKADNTLDKLITKKKAVTEENEEIAERFKQIMDMFDNFTKNLESLEIPPLKDSPKLVRKKRLNLKDSKEINPRVHRSRYEDFLKEMGGESDSETALPELQLQKISKLKELPSVYTSEGEPRSTRPVAELPVKTKDISTTISGIALSRAALLAATTEGINIAVQTSLHRDLNSVPTSQASASTSQSDVQNIENYATDLRADAMAGVTSDVITIQSNLAAGSVAKKIDSDGSGLTLVKISESPSVIELSPITNAPCERTFHTIHIEATSSPTSSVMRRPPLWTRFWNVISEFCGAICMCLQVNKDCIFCLGFFIAFVVSASFLTAFFYRTLSVTPQVYQHSSAPAVHIGSNAKERDSTFYYL